jgi:hypothetical protein
MKFPEETTGEKSLDIGIVNNFLDTAPKAEMTGQK